MAVLLVWCGCAAAAPAASAQGDQVFVAPDSPSGREYELPVDSARQRGATKPATAGDPAPAPLFGAGVEPGGAGATAGERTGGARGAPAAGSGAVSGANGSRRAAAPHEVQAAAPTGALGLVTVIGAGGAVVLVGGLAGLWLRRRSSG